MGRTGRSSDREWLGLSDPAQQVPPPPTFLPKDGNRSHLEIRFTNEIILIPKEQWPEREVEIHTVRQEGDENRINICSKNIVSRHVARDSHGSPVRLLFHGRFIVALLRTSTAFPREALTFAAALALI